MEFESRQPNIQDLSHYAYHQCHVSEPSWKYILRPWSGLQVTVVVVQLLSHVWFFETPWTSMLDCPVLHYLYEFAQKLMSLESVMPFNHLVLSPPSPPVLALSASGSCPRSQLFSLGGQRIGASASASVLSMNIEGWFPSGLTGLIFLLPKGLSKVSSTTSQKLQVFSAQPHLWS